MAVEGALACAIPLGRTTRAICGLGDRANFVPTLILPGAAATLPVTRLPGVDAGLQEFAEGWPQFGANCYSQIAENFFVVGKHDSVFAVLLLSVHVKTNRVKTTSVGSSDLKVSSWQEYFGQRAFVG
jgi:hypothetical protein